ncbi:hypothetical protein GJ744_011009 [Endocarpon pusillum]|uniref:Uncharacterized protein n=1 Tax=Endocarpon pusillum TaxID=364733 RepID=A0A8H7AD90_9EURO|nr:hypothetical protein GJ744_011009 [Endocarpon pusillum]
MTCRPKNIKKLRDRVTRNNQRMMGRRGQVERDLSPEVLDLSTFGYPQEPSSKSCRVEARVPQLLGDINPLFLLSSSFGTHLEMRQAQAQEEEVRLEAEKKINFKGTARIKLEHPHFQRSEMRELNGKHVERLKRYSRSMAAAD